MNDLWYKTYTAEQIHELTTPYAEEIEKRTGCTTQWKDESNWESYYSGYNVFYMDNLIGSVHLNYFGEPGTVVLSLDTKVSFTMKSTFTKTAMRHDIKVSTGVRRDLTDTDKYIDWLKLICTQYKTALAKKARFEADTDFE